MQITLNPSLVDKVGMETADMHFDTYQALPDDGSVSLAAFLKAYTNLEDALKSLFLTLPYDLADMLPALVMHKALDRKVAPSIIIADLFNLS